MPKFLKISKKITKVTIDNPKLPKKIEWYNILDPEKKEISFLKKEFNFDDKHLEASLVKMTAQRPMIYNGKNYLFIIMHFPVLEKGQIVPSEIEFFVGHGFLVTLHDNKTKALKEFIEQCSEDKIFPESYKYESSAILLYEILEKLIQDSYTLLDENNIEISNVEKNIFENKQSEITSQLLILKRNIINIRRIIQNHKNIMKKLTEMESTLVPQEQIKNYYDNLAEHSQRIWEFSEIQKEIIESLHDTSESVSSYRINNIMKTLTIVSVIIMPLNLFINLFGMNFNPSPPEENIKLFMNIILISSLSGLLLLLFFKKKKWL
ncbi:hypothetical protein CVU82_02120 [Candidatus Falkowbacteria bacterium HGW-Falkowbacteria-1]|uniref:Magnesium transporter n=1 Tax=Candidatus Falkowbacteria bacterium HGW-Falkowbacteria-1 TaxID=2013768 RepID=A0A2N2E9G2_9BACT|nr:MAG: hypothetical protein CVU82_02120 [Candidatus Falkowbacteria bacterium HGW-Falkowbacteria-1]